MATTCPGAAWADVALPPPPKKTPSGATPTLPPPPAKKKPDTPAKAAPSEAPASTSGTTASSSGTRSDRTTAIVLLVVGGVVTLAGTSMMLFGAGVRPDGKKGGGASDLLVPGAITTSVGLGVGVVGLVLLLRSNNGRLPPLKSLAQDHPASRAPTWSSDTGPTLGGGLALPLTAGVF